MEFYSARPFWLRTAETAASRSGAAPRERRVFPLAYSVILSALYLPLVLMLGGVIWRGVAFEFRIARSLHRLRAQRQDTMSAFAGKVN